MLTLEWLNSSISLTNASSALSEDSNTFLPKVFLREWVEKYSTFKSYLYLILCKQDLFIELNKAYLWWIGNIVHSCCQCVMLGSNL